MVISKTFLVEHLINGERIEYEYSLEAEYEPFVRGNVSGPPENCYPDEGGYATIDDGPVARRKVDPRGLQEKVPLSILLEAVVENHNLLDDPPDKKYGQTALQKAEKFLLDELAQDAEDEARDQYEDAMESRGDW